jgi:ribokinase
MKSTPDIVVLGAHGSGGNMVHIDHVPVPGESIIAKDFRIFKDGGKGAHQALVIGRLGGSSAFIGKIANGPRNDAAKQWLIDDGVNVKHLLREGEESPHAGLIMLDRDGVSTIVSVPGLRHRLTYEEAKPGIEDFASASMFITGFEIPVETALKGAKRAKELGMMTILNPAPISMEPLGVLDYIDIVIPNEAEAKGMAGVDLNANVVPSELATAIRDKSKIATVIITLGGDGAFGYDGETSWQIDPVEVDVVNSTGAGDAFIGSFAWALSSGKDMQDAATYANFAAAISVSRDGTIDSFPTPREVEDFIRKYQ